MAQHVLNIVVKFLERNYLHSFVESAQSLLVLVKANRVPTGQFGLANNHSGASCGFRIAMFGVIVIAMRFAPIANVLLGIAIRHVEMYP